MNSQILGNKRITELDPLPKLTGKELMLIDDGNDSLKVTVDTLLGYIAKEINSGTIGDDVFSSCNIIEIPENEDIPIVSRLDGNYYIITVSTDRPQISVAVGSVIRVSPNMALKIVE